MHLDDQLKETLEHGKWSDVTEQVCMQARVLKEALDPLRDELEKLKGSYWSELDP